MVAPYHADERVKVHHGDALEALPEIPESSVDAVVTDPPYALGFMGKAWDTHTPGGFQHWCELWAAECLRILKPGGHLLAFGGTRTYHRLTSGIEDAGFEIRDSLHWLYGSGFPKSLDVSKAIDKAAGAEREVVGRHEQAKPGNERKSRFADTSPARQSLVWQYDLTAPATPEAQRWSGYGTALKPAHEPIVLARKPLAGTVAANVQQYGTGAINVDGCRVATGEDTRRNARGGDNGLNGSGTFRIRERRAGEMPARDGRWPANVLLDDEAAAELDRQSGGLRARGNRAPTVARKDDVTTFGRYNGTTVDHGPGDSGGASRFFPTFRYQPKAPARERPTVNGVKHPTVKPVALMRWLVRLVTPPGGLVLDPFAGSGATVEAALLEGFRCVAVEREAEYLPLVDARLERVPPVIGFDMPA